MSGEDVLTTEALRNKLFQTLQNRGLVDALKTQLRNRLVSELKNVGQSLHGATHEGQRESLTLRASNSLVADHLKHSGYDYTLSIFLPECHSAASATLLSVEDILKLLHISPQSQLYTSLTQPGIAHQRGFLWTLINALAETKGFPTLSTGTQTEASRYPASSSSLEEEFRKVDAQYTELQESQLSRIGAVEERILLYQRQLEERSRSDRQLEMARFRDNELARLEVEQREKIRREVDRARKEIERSYQAKYDAVIERERSTIEAIQRQQEILEKETFSQRQSVLANIECLREREIQLKRQDEINNREKQLFEETTKSREELARRREDSARQMELEYQQRLKDEVTKFKLEEKARHIDQVTNLEVREAKVKDNERRVNSELQDISNVKVELRDYQTKARDLEEELIRTRHDLIASEKQREILGDKSRQMVDYQILKENTNVLKHEHEALKMRIAELTRDNHLLQEKIESLLREMSHVESKPSREVFMLRKQMEQYENSRRTETALHEREKMILEQQLQTQAERNKQLVAKYEDQTWHQKEMGREAIDLRQQLGDTRQALYRRAVGDLNRSDSLYDLDIDDVRTGIDADLMFDSLCSNDGGVVGGGRDMSTPVQHSDDYSYASDIVKDTKNRVRRLEQEADRLEKHYHDCTNRIINLDPVLDPNPSYLTRSKVTFEEKTSLKPERRPAGDFSREPLTNMLVPQSSGVPARRATIASTTHDSLGPGQSRTESRTTRTDRGSDTMVDKKHVGHADRSPTRVDYTASVVDVGKRKNMSDRGTPTHSPTHTYATSVKQPEDKTPRGRASSSSPVSRAGHTVVTDSVSRAPSSGVIDSVDHASSPATGVTSKTSSPAVYTGVSSSPPINTGGVSRTDQSDVLRVSLDDAWRPAASVDTTANSFQVDTEAERRRKEDNDRLKREADEERDYEEERVRLTERRRQEDEEAWRKEQQALEELEQQRNKSPIQQRMCDKSSGSESASQVVSHKSTEAPPAAAVSIEPPIDPEMQKYMQLVQQKKDADKQTSKEAAAVKTPEKQESSGSDSEISIAVEDSDDDDDDVEEKEDVW